MKMLAKHQPAPDAEPQVQSAPAHRAAARRMAANETTMAPRGAKREGVQLMPASQGNKKPDPANLHARRAAPPTLLLTAPLAVLLAVLLAAPLAARRVRARKAQVAANPPVVRKGLKGRRNDPHHRRTVQGTAA